MVALIIQKVSLDHLGTTKNIYQAQKHECSFRVCRVTVALGLASRLPMSSLSVPGDKL